MTIIIMQLNQYIYIYIYKEEEEKGLRETFGGTPKDETFLMLSPYCCLAKALLNLSLCVNITPLSSQTYLLG